MSTLRTLYYPVRPTTAYKGKLWYLIFGHTATSPPYLGSQNFPMVNLGKTGILGETDTMQTIQTVAKSSRNFQKVHFPASILENQLRCGEHTDYGSLTLLFQDEAGGLQV